MSCNNDAYMENKEKTHFRKWNIPALVLLALLTALAVKGRDDKREIPFQSDEGVIFGTVYHVKYQHGESLKAEIQECLSKVDNSLSMFNDESKLSRINSDQTTETDSMLQVIFPLARKVSMETNGAFDITVAPLVNAWGFGFKHGEFPDQEMVDSLLALVDWTKVSVSDGHISKPKGVVIDLGAVAKGFGVDMVANVMKSHGVANYMIEIGGEVVTKGSNPSGDAWRIGINRPDDDSTCTNYSLQEVLAVNDACLATSGNYRNFYVKDGKKIAHTIDPRTGYPVQHSLLSSTVMAPDCATADAYATSFMVMGIDSAKTFLGSHPELQAYFIYTSGDGGYATYMTDGMKRYIESK